MTLVADAPARDGDANAWAADRPNGDKFDDKFVVPALPGTFIERPRLAAALFAMTTRRLTVVSGPGGAGKTCLLAGFARSRAIGTTAWCRLDDRDVDAQSFGVSVLQSVLAARTLSGFGELTSVRSSSPDPLEQAVELAAHGPHLLLVFDDVERLSTGSARGALQRLLNLAPQNLSTVLVTRHDPEYDLHRLRGESLRTVRAGDLAFTAAEASALFGRYGIDVPERDVETLTAWTEGSAVALHLAALYIRSAERQRLLAEARLGERAVVDYLLSAVLAVQPPDLRDFLIRTAVVDSLPIPLARVIVDDDDAARHLEAAARRQLLVMPVEGADGVYQHHSLIANLLRATLHHELPAEEAVLHARAARWFEAAQRPDDALRHAATAGDWQTVARIVVETWIASVLEGARGPAGITSYVLPLEVRGRDATHSLAAAIQCLELGEHQSAARWLAVAVADDEGTIDREDRQLVAALISMCLACEGIDTAREIDQVATVVLEMASDDFALVEAGDRIATLAWLARAEARLRDGDLVSAAELLERVASSPRDDDLVTGTAIAMLALTEALRGRLRRAAALIDEVGESWATRSSANHRGVRSLAVALCAYHADELSTARAGLADARASLRAGVFRDVVAPALGARLAKAGHDERAAKRLLVQVPASGRLPLVAVLGDALGLAELSEHRRPTSRTATEAGAEVAHPYALVFAHLRAALDYEMRQEQSRAEWEIERALALMDRHGFRRGFVDFGCSVRDLLIGYVAEVRPFRMLATQLLERMWLEDDQSTAQMVEQLTERELTVLRYLPTMMSNGEIASEMFFSVNTVKTHLKSIYRKLGVARRREAVDRARRLSLI